MRPFRFFSSVFAASTLTLASCSHIFDFSTGPKVEPEKVESAETAAPKEAHPTLPAGISLIEKIDVEPGATAIAYAKYRLDNGLTVILHEDSSDPMVHVDVTYHVGSGREELGRSGFAHFFEHMQFQGSENVADEEHFKIVSESGGTLNGTTNTDRTNYFQTVPSNQLEKMLWLESDRMGWFLDAVTQEKFEVQRETVKNERAQRVDNAPYGLVWEKLSEASYPEGHPYSWTTIGYIEDLNRADLDDLKRFFLRWYGPNNATLTIGGDIDISQTLDWIIKYFGAIKEGPQVDKPEYVPVTLSEDRYISYEDNVSLPLLLMSWPTVHVMHEDEAPLDVLMSIMGDGRTSLLYKNLIKDGFAVSANAGHSCQELSCLFTLSALPNPASGQTLSDLEAKLRSSIAEFETRGVEPDDLEKVKAGIVSGMVFNLESLYGKVGRLAYYETFFDDPNTTPADIARYERVTQDDVMRVYKKYIKDQPSVILSVVPKGQGDTIAAPDTWTMYDRTFPERPNEGELALRRSNAGFDRSIQPPAADFNPTVKLPDIWRSELSNGVKVLGVQSQETPTTALTLRIETGQRAETLEKLGLSSLTASMLGEATLSSTNEELSNRLDKLGSSISVDSNARYTTLSIKSLTEKLDETLAIARERLMEPAFAEEDFNRLVDQTLQSIEQSKKQPSTVASQAFQLLLFGHDTPSAWPSLGTEETVKAISLDDVRSFYQTWYKPNIAAIVTVSDLSQSELIEKMSVFDEWTGTAPLPVKPPEPSELTPGTLYLIDNPGAAQSEIRIGRHALPFDATGEYFRAGLSNFILGGAFNSRINLNLREDKGYSYGARSGFSGSDVSGVFTASAGVRTDATTDSVRQFFKEISAYYEDGITADELAFTQRAIGQRDARSYETPSNKLGFISRILTYDLPDGFVDTQNDILEDFTKEEVDALAQKWMSPDDMVIVVVGDKEKILDNLKTLEYPIVELDSYAKPVE